MTNRLSQFRQLLSKNNLSAALVSDKSNIAYLSGFSGSSARLIVSADQTFIATDSRYWQQASEECPNFTLLKIERKTLEWLSPLLQSLNTGVLAYEDSLSHKDFLALQEALVGSNGIELQSLGDCLRDVRAIKSDTEIKFIREAVRITDLAYTQTVANLEEGVSEEELAWETEKIARNLNGGQPLAFSLIVAFGARSALPHARPSSNRLEKNQALLFDMGVSVQGYTSDMSRSFFFGKVPPDFVKIYDTVLSAQQKLIAEARPGMSGGELDELARTVIRQAGFDGSFGHGTGHGLGLAIHEKPSLSPQSADLVLPGMVFTVEPGIYLTGRFGVRIEDTVLMTENGIEVLTQSPKFAGYLF